ncbi:MAG: TRAP transporter small permease [Syntrophomonas sp.]
MFSKAIDHLERFVDYFIGSLMLLVTLILCVNVLTRYCFGFSLTWAEELTTYSIIWLTFLGSGLCVKRELHVSVDAILLLLPHRGRKFMTILAYAVGLIFSLLLMILGLDLTSQVTNSGQLSPAMMLPMQCVCAAVPVGAAFMILEYVLIIIKKIKEPAGEVAQLTDQPNNA